MNYNHLKGELLGPYMSCLGIVEWCIYLSWAAECCFTHTVKFYKLCHIIATNSPNTDDIVVSLSSSFQLDVVVHDTPDAVVPD